VLLYEGTLFEFYLGCLFFELLDLELELNYGIRKAVQFFFPFLTLKLPNDAMVTLLVRVTLLRRLGCLDQLSVCRLDLGIAIQYELVDLL
jgi:hypothetical protein